MSKTTKDIKKDTPVSDAPSSEESSQRSSENDVTESRSRSDASGDDRLDTTNNVAASPKKRSVTFSDDVQVMNPPSSSPFGSQSTVSLADGTRTTGSEYIVSPIPIVQEEPVLDPASREQSSYVLSTTRRPEPSDLTDEANCDVTVKVTAPTDEQISTPSEPKLVQSNENLTQENTTSVSTQTGSGTVDVTDSISPREDQTADSDNLSVSSAVSEQQGADMDSISVGSAVSEPSAMSDVDSASSVQAQYGSNEQLNSSSVSDLGSDAIAMADVLLSLQDSASTPRYDPPGTSNKGKLSTATSIDAQGNVTSAKDGSDEFAVSGDLRLGTYSTPVPEREERESTAGTGVPVSGIERTVDLRREDNSVEKKETAALDRSTAEVVAGSNRTGQSGRPSQPRAAPTEEPDDSEEEEEIPSKRNRKSEQKK